MCIETLLNTATTRKKNVIFQLPKQHHLRWEEQKDAKVHFYKEYITELEPFIIQANIDKTIIYIADKTCDNIGKAIGKKFGSQK